MTNPWLEERRDLFTRNVLQKFLKAHAFFQELRGQIEQGENISYDGLHGWVGTQGEKGLLWRLKDSCNLLWKHTQPESQPEGLVFSCMTGTIFHEAMKLKENIYMSHRYRPKCHAMASASKKPPITCQQFFDETVKETKRGMERLQCMFRYASEELHIVLQKNRHNPLLVRFILEEQAHINKIWEEFGGTEKLLGGMFPAGWDEAYCIAGESYLEGGWYAEARVAYDKALALNPHCETAAIGLQILGKRLKDLPILSDRDLQQDVRVANPYLIEKQEFLRLQGTPEG